MSKYTIIKVQTYSCQYVAKEDRLLLTINYQEIQNRIDFWLTRSFLLKLLPCFFDYLSLSPEISPPETVEDNKSELNKVTTDMSTFVLTQKEPCLLDSVDFSYTQDKSIKIVLKSIERGIFCIGILDQSAFASFVNLLTETVPTMEWGIYSLN